MKAADREQMASLLRFAQKVLEHRIDGFNSIDPEAIEDAAAQAGLLDVVQVSEPCGGVCMCELDGNIPGRCVRPTQLLEEGGEMGLLKQEPIEIEIEPCGEGRLMLWAKGHVDPTQFADTCHRAAQNQGIDPEQLRDALVVQKHWRVVKVAKDTYRHVDSEPTRGAKAVTVLDVKLKPKTNHRPAGFAPGM